MRYLYADPVVYVSGVLGTVTAWAGRFDLMNKGLAFFISGCTAIVVAPKAYQEVLKFWKAFRKWRASK